MTTMDPVSQMLELARPLSQSLSQATIEEAKALGSSQEVRLLREARAISHVSRSDVSKFVNMLQSLLSKHGEDGLRCLSERLKRFSITLAARGAPSPVDIPISSQRTY